MQGGRSGQRLSTAIQLLSNRRNEMNKYGCTRKFMGCGLDGSVLQGLQHDNSDLMELLTSLRLHSIIFFTTIVRSEWKAA